jgi:hypothetical protein
MCTFSGASLSLLKWLVAKLLVEEDSQRVHQHFAPEVSTQMPGDADLERLDRAPIHELT